jgi:uracil-DNA glycosylase
MGPFDSAAADNLAGSIPESWRSVLAPAIDRSRFAALATWLEAERKRVPVYPPRDLVFHALELTPPENVRAVILGQDPYHGPGQAQGLAFSVPDHLKAPASLRAIIRELKVDGRPHSLEPWARRGVLLLNTVLTVEHGRPGSHRRKGWEEITDAIIESVAASPRPVAFLLWGRDARSKRNLIAGEHHIVHVAGHPASRPYPRRAADLYFAGRAGFTEVNEELRARGLETLEWSLGPV